MKTTNTINVSQTARTGNEHIPSFFCLKSRKGTSLMVIVLEEIKIKFD